MNKVLTPFIERNELAGAVTLVARGQDILELDACGYSDVAARSPMLPDTLFWIASQTKPMTAAAFMMLVDEGKARIEDPVEAYLPEFKEIRVAENREDGAILLRKPKTTVTLRHLLSHTSGLPFRSFIEEPHRDVVPLPYSVRSYAMTPLEFEPGTRYQYSNAGINTIGRVIERLSGQAYETFLANRLLEPLGMTDTVFRPSQKQLARLARAYTPGPDGKGLVETTMTQYSQPFSDPKRQAVPGGGLFSTARDVSLFCRMMLNRGEWGGRRYLSEQSVDAMTRKQTGDSVSAGYGLGCETDGESFGHGGAFGTTMRIEPGRNLVLIFLVQHSGFPGKGADCRQAFLKDARARFSPGEGALV
jgi:CubicO group peptidase (beta-lactamase class C family)